MVTIYVPTFAVFRDDVEKMMGILETAQRDYGNGFEIGLEIGGKLEHFTTDEGLARITENINGVSEWVSTIVHGFSGLEIYEKDGKESHLADMSTKNGAGVLDVYIGLAKKIGSRYVHVHGGAGYQGVGVPKDKSLVLGAIRRNLLGGLRGASDNGIEVGIENLPGPSCCDFDSNPYTVWRDYVQGVEDCEEVVNGTDLRVTFDTAHHALNRVGFIDLISPARRLGKHLRHIHVCDVQGYWHPNNSLSYDGLIPGEGNIGKMGFGDFFKYVGREHPDIGICMEVRPSDFKNPVEFRESIDRVWKWLDAA